jgi:hypothetical protein
VDGGFDPVAAEDDPGRPLRYGLGRSVRQHHDADASDRILAAPAVDDVVGAPAGQHGPGRGEQLFGDLAVATVGTEERAVATRFVAAEQPIVQMLAAVAAQALRWTVAGPGDVAVE